MACHGRIEAEGGGVKQQAGTGDRVGPAAHEIADVDGFANQGMPLLGQVNADLVGAPSLQPDPTKGRMSPLLDHLHIRDGVLASAEPPRTSAQTVATVLNQVGFDAARCCLKISCKPRSASLVFAKQTRPEVSLSMR